MKFFLPFVPILIFFAFAVAIVLIVLVTSRCAKIISARAVKSSQKGSKQGDVIGWRAICRIKDGDSVVLGEWSGIDEERAEEKAEKAYMNYIWKLMKENPQVIFGERWLEPIYKQ